MRADLPIGISTAFDYRVPFDVMCQLVRDAGFRAIAIGAEVGHSGYNQPERLPVLSRLFAENGLMVDSIHAPLGSEADISVPDATITAEQSPTGQEPSGARLAAVSGVKAAIAAAAELGCQVVVVHPATDFPATETRNRIASLRASLKELVPYAAERKVRLALENMPSLLVMQVTEAVLEEFPEVGVCYDTSHAQLSTNPFGILQRYGERIIAVHISDNRGEEDDHLLPFDGIIDWQEFALYAYRLENIPSLLLEVETRKWTGSDIRMFIAEAYARATRLLGLPQRIRREGDL